MRAVNSVLQQTYPVHEVLICDDGSTDSSKSLIEKLNDPKVKWLDCGRNGMPSIPRNKGIKTAAGEWIAFLDSDDEWLPTKLEKQMQLLKSSGAMASTCNCSRWVEGKNLGPFFKYGNKEIIFSDLLPVNMNICSSVIVSKKILEETSLFPEGKEYKAIEDYALWLRLATKTPFAYVNEALVNYYDDPAGSIRSDNNSETELKKIILGGLVQWIADNKIQVSESDLKKLQKTFADIGKAPTLLQKIKKKLKD